jgi:hypothetical protein
MGLTRRKAAVLGAAMAIGAGMAGTVPEPREDEPAPPPPRWQETQRQAREAHDAGDFQAYRAGVQHLFNLLSGHPDTVWAMAKAEALLGHTAAALDWLNAYAAMGLTHDFDRPMAPSPARTSSSSPTAAGTCWPRTARSSPGRP